MLQKQSSLVIDCMSPVKQLTEELQKTDKAVTVRIDTVLCIKKDEIRIELSSEKLGSSVNLNVANANYSFLKKMYSTQKWKFKK